MGQRLTTYPSARHPQVAQAKAQAQIAAAAAGRFPVRCYLSTYVRSRQLTVWRPHEKLRIPIQVYALGAAPGPANLRE
eukprot:gene12346-biopygen8814